MCVCVCVCVCVCNSSMWDDTYHSAGKQRYVSRVEVMRVVNLPLSIITFLSHTYSTCRYSSSMYLLLTWDLLN